MRHGRSRILAARAGVILLVVVFGLIWLPLFSAQAAAPLQGELLMTPMVAPPGEVADRCEPNDTLVQPCAIPTEVETADLTFVDDAIDVYSVFLKARRSYAIRAMSTSGIDPLLTVFLAGATDQPVMQNDDLAAGSADAGVQITTGADGWYLIQVENRAPGDMRGRTYRLSVRSSAPLTEGNPVAATATPARLGDAFENNWRAADAPRIAWDVPYDLSLVCPEDRAGACISGDHDFFRVMVKAGVPFAALTYDLGPGADTTLAIYRPAPAQTDDAAGISGWQLVQGNDDAVRGWTLRSQLVLTPSWDGEALLIVAPSERADPPQVPDAVGPGGRYRLIAGSPFLPGVAQVLAAQQGRQGAPQQAGGDSSGSAGRDPNAAASASLPALGPTILPTPAPVAGDSEEIIREECLTGLARVTNPSGARFSAAAMPGVGSRILMIYPLQSEVQLLGSCYLGWVKVRPLQAVSPGWMYAPDLELLEASVDGVQATPQAAASVTTTNNADQANTSVQADNQAAIRQVRVMPLPPRAIPTATNLARQALSVTVTILDGQGQPRAGMRVQLVDVLGTVLREGQADSQGSITLVADLPFSAAAWVQVPAAGITLLIDKAAPDVAIVVP